MKCGVLIIGSLLWDDETPGRSEWREKRLSMPDRISASAHFHYGRKSQSRGNTFTMAFSADVPLARGVVVPCTHQVASLGDLLSEAISLWKAEAPGAATGAIGAGWGCVGALFGSDQNARRLESAWASHSAKAKVQCTPVIGADGRAHLPWPIAGDGNPVDFDVILFTATTAEAKKPTVEEVADAWIAQSKRFEKYFFLNVQNGIRTPEDLDIWKRIKSKAPDWPNLASYPAAVETLQSDLS